jgi:hypothetical protein
VVSSLRISPGEQVLISVREHNAPAVDFSGFGGSGGDSAVDDA